MVKNAAKVISIVVVLTMVFGAFAVVMSTGVAKNAPASKVAIADPSPMDVDPQMKSEQLNLGSEAAVMQLMSAPGANFDVGQYVKYYVGSYGKWYYNGSAMDPLNTHPMTNWMWFQKRAERQNCEVWVATDLLFYPGDPRNDGRVVITDAQANYIADQFNGTIYPTESGAFGLPPQNDGSNNFLPANRVPIETNVSGRVMIMVFNIVDQSFFDYNYPYYIAGFFSPSVDSLYDRNIIHVDCWDWANRTTGSTPRPFLYEGTVAHEYQHLLNNEFNPDQATFLNEGCSDFAIYLCGYGPSYDHINAFMATPDNSLTDWSDQGDLNILADYGAAVMYIHWLYDHFGLGFVTKLVNSTWGNETFSGAAAVEAAFQNLGYTKWDFDRSFNSWRLANLIWADSPGNGLYNYKSLDKAQIDDVHVNAYDPLNTYAQSGNGYVESAAWEFGKTINQQGIILDSGMVGSYGTDYIRVQSEPLGAPGVSWSWATWLNQFELKLGFAGDPVVKKGWQVVDVPVGFGDTVFSEDFNSGLGNWNLWSTGSWTQYWTTESHPENGSDLYAIAYADNPDSTGYLVRTWMGYDGSFSTVGYSHLQLDFQSDFATVYRNTQMGNVWFSVDGGVTWKALGSVTSASGGFTDVSMNADDLCGFPSVTLAFEYYADNQYGPSEHWAIDNITVKAVNTTKMWWSDRGDLVDYSLVGTVDLTGFGNESEINLGLDTMWNLEDQWDFGFVQVSTDGGQTWTSIEGTYTTFDHDAAAIQTVIDNLPGITGMNPSWGQPGWAGLNHAEFDLSDYAGMVIELRFREITDWATNYDGWFIKNVTINGDLIENADNVTSFAPMNAYESNKWFVSVYATNNGFDSAYDGLYYLPIVMNLNLVDGASVQKALDSLVVYNTLYILVSPQIGPADYGFGIFNGFDLFGPT
ncbi:MAG TPA: hypothetical protein VMB46_07910 [Methanomassiliicoccales archaeon]|nr:hypothetical protein [Methanomassiliicoccales archaeon]